MVQLAQVVARIMTLPRYSVALMGVLLVVGSAVLGCGSQAVSSASTGLPVGLNALIRTLENGETLTDVEAKLGAPDRADEAGDEKVLYYGHWQLSFAPGLRSRTKYFRGEHWTDHRALAERIRRLPLKASMGVVRVRLGIPWALQILKSRSPEEVILFYGGAQWELEFIEGALAGRNHS
jgi:hypothetical protein